MARIPYSYNNYVGGAPQATLSGTITSTATTIIVSGTTASGWTPLGQTGGFVLALDYNTSNEEKVWVPSGSYAWGNPTVTLSNVERAYDGTGVLFTTSGYNHQNGASVVHVLAATDLTEANTLVSELIGPNSVSGMYVGSGSLVYGGGALAFGVQALASGAQTTALGNGAIAYNYGLALGSFSLASGSNYSIAIGNFAQAFGAGALAIGTTGDGAYAYGQDSIAIGDAPTASGSSCIAIGDSPFSTGSDAFALGRNSTSEGTNLIAFGVGTIALGSGCIAFGADHTNAGAVASGVDQIIIGTKNHTVTVPGSFTNVFNTPVWHFNVPGTSVPYKGWTFDPVYISTSTTSLTAGTAFYTAIWISQTVAISGIQFNISSATAGSNIYVALFNNTTQVATCSGVPSPGSAGFVTALISGGTYTASPGLYYIGIILSGSAANSISSAGSSATIFNFNNGNNSNTLANLRSASVSIGSRAFYGTGGTVSGTIAPTANPLWFVAF